MKNYLYLKRLSVVILVAMIHSTPGNPQTLLVENFNYATGTSLTANGWSSHSGAGNNPVVISSTGLIYSGYPSSNIGLAALLANDGEDVNKTFTPITTGNVYCAFLMQANSMANDYFFHLSNSGISSNRARIFIKGTGSSFNLGLSKGAENASYTTGSTYITGTTYLLVLKYSIAEGASNDNVSLFILNGPAPATEPATPSIGPLSEASQSDLSNVSAVALRQYSAAQNIVIDGIRVAQKWENAVGTTTGYQDYYKKTDPVIFPIPAEDLLTVSNIYNVKGIEVLDFAGRSLITIKTDFSEKTNISLSDLCSGFYLLKLNSPEGSRIMKFIKR